MKHRNLKAIGLALVISLAVAAGASAAPTADSNVSIAGQGTLYADQNDGDYAAFTKAVDEGRITVERGV